MSPLHWLASGVGIALLAATAHVTILHTGGYHSSHAVLTIAVAVGVGIASLCIGSAWAARRRVVAVWLILTILAGEAFGLLATSERLLASREAAQAPLRAAEGDYARAARRVKRAEATLQALTSTSGRLSAAEVSKLAADNAAVQKSAERGCLDNCRKLLQAQVDAAAAEVADARRELLDGRRTAEDELRAARAALATIPPPRSPNALADRLNAPAWGIDLVVAALGSIAANGLACALLVFGAHRRETPLQVMEIIERTAASAAASQPPRRRAARAVRKAVDRATCEHAARFAVERLKPSPDAVSTDLLLIHQVYGDWCQARGIQALPGPRIGEALSALFAKAGISIDRRDGRLVAVGVELKA